MKKKRRKAQRWRGLTTLFGSLGAILLGVTLLADSFVREINSFMGIASAEVVNADGSSEDDHIYYGSEFASIDEMMQAKNDLCEEITDEGIVLLKNNGALPLENAKNVTCLGRGSVDLVYAGASGAGIIGNVGTSINATLKDGLEDAGYLVNPTMWDFYVNSGYTRSNGGSGGNDAYRIGEVPVSEYPHDKGYEDYSDACIVVFTRNSGESNEAPVGEFEDGEVYYQLQEAEKAVLEEAEANFETVIVFVNSPSALSVEELRQDDGVDAILTAGGLGMNGARSLGKILSGEVNPSGRLTDTYAVDSLSSPALQNHGDYSFTNADEIIAASENGLSEHNTNYLVQAEGIYTGYKYYETRYEDCVLSRGNAASEAGTFASAGDWNYAEEVSYSMGYGMSYTTFEQEIENIEVSDNVIYAQVKVTNTGKVPGKEVVQLYVQSPYTDYDRANGIEKASVQMVNFGKTDLLQSGESESINIRMDLYNICSYDTNGQGTWILDDGTYYFAVGNSAHDALNNILAIKGKTTADGMDYDGNADLARKWINDEFRTFENPEFTENGFTTLDGTYHNTTDAKVTNQVQAAELNNWIDGAVTYLSRSDWSATWPKSVDSLVATDEMIPHLLAQTYEPGSTDTSDITADADTDYQVSMMRGKDYADEEWNKILDQMSLEEMMSLVGKDFSATEPIPSISYPGTIENDGPSGCVTNYSSKYDGDSTIFEGIDKYSQINPRMYPSECLVACTYNQELVYRLGQMNGEDCYYTGQSTIWAPGINLHRSPYSGRNFEYFSEDSMITYILGAQEVAGIQSKGAVAAPKHFVFNDYEMNRFGLCTFLNEQTARENGLRAFEGAVAVGHAKNVMTTLARIGCDWMGYSSELQDNVLRGEWGFDGFTVTDNSIMPYMYGNSITCGTDKFVVFIPGRYEEQLAPEIVSRDEKLLTSLREACHRILYVNVNSMAMNGVSDDAVVKDVTPGWQMLLFTVSGVLWAFTLVCLMLFIRADRKFRKELKSHE